MSRSRRLLCVLATMTACLGAAGSAAAATDPHETVAGPSGKWASGDLIQQIGQNCSVLGSPYTETMVSGISSYGGGADGGVAKVGQRYWTSLLLSIPGNPCGPGSSAVATDVILPRGTTIDTSAPIRCFGQPRNSNDIIELTGGSWNAFGGSGPYCPSSAAPSARNAGALSIGYRPLASGQLFWVFVPVISTQVLSGSGTSDRIVWVTDATGVYENPGASQVWTWVFDGAAPTGPFVYFTRSPNPFWKPDGQTAPSDQRNRVEFWANFYTAGQAGNVCFEIRFVSNNGLVANCGMAPGWNGNVPAGNDYIQILPAPGDSTGPGGGYVPFAYDPPGEWGQEMRITWTFTPTGGSQVSSSQTFRTLPGPDTDGDGVADSADACPAVSGTLANGCMPAVQDDPDKDGVFGAADRCPDADGLGSLDGCPPAVAPPVAPPVTPVVPALPGVPPAGPVAIPSTAAMKGRITRPGKGQIARTGLLAKKGVPVKLSCTRNATATLALDVSAKTARKLRLPRRTRTLATAKGRCIAGKTLTLRLRAGTKVRSRLRSRSVRVSATLRLTLRAPGQRTARSTASVTVR